MSVLDGIGEILQRDWYDQVERILKAPPVLLGPQTRAEAEGYARSCRNLAEKELVLSGVAEAFKLYQMARCWDVWAKRLPETAPPPPPPKVVHWKSYGRTA